MAEPLIVRQLVPTPALERHYRAWWNLVHRRNAREFHAREPGTLIYAGFSAERLLHGLWWVEHRFEPFYADADCPIATVENATSKVVELFTWDDIYPLARFDHHILLETS